MGYSGYDANYAEVSLAFLGLCARRDPEAAAFLARCWSAIQHFYIPDADSPVGVSLENATSRRVTGPLSRSPQLCIAGITAGAHPAATRLYELVAGPFSKDVQEQMQLKSPHHFQIMSYLYTEWLDRLTPPQHSEYRLPAERPGPWEWRDPEARLMVFKSEANQLTYYVECWEDPGQARRVVWGCRPQNSPSLHLFQDQ